MIRPELPAFIDSSMLVQFRLCPRKFYWEYLLNLRPTGRQIDLVAGSAFAAALEAAYRAYYIEFGSVSKFDALKEGLRAAIEAWGDFPPEGDGKSAKTFDRIVGAMISYFETYGWEDDHVKPMLRQDGTPSFEFSFAVPLTDDRFPRHPVTGDPFMYSGRFDAFGHLHGRMVVRDEKTSGRAPGAFWSTDWDLRNQFIMYCWACQQLGFPVDTVVVRGITIQKTQYQHAEAVKTYPNHLIERAVDQVARDLHRLVDCYNSGYFDYNFGDACKSWGRPCAYMILCADDKPERWFGEYERVRWDPLTRTTTPVEKEAA